MHICEVTGDHMKVSAQRYICSTRAVLCTHRLLPNSQTYTHRSAVLAYRDWGLYSQDTQAGSVETKKRAVKDSQISVTNIIHTHC